MVFAKQLLHVGMVGMFTKLLVGMGLKKVIRKLIFIYLFKVLQLQECTSV